jgi:hypothetical protein
VLPSDNGEPTQANDQATSPIAAPNMAAVGGSIFIGHNFGER